jgi:hypothetical protein
MPPPTIVFSDVSNTAIILRWTDPAISCATGGVAIESYEISWAINSGVFSFLVTIPFGSNSFTHSALAGGATYSYAIKASNKYGAALTLSSTVSMQTG